MLLGLLGAELLLGHGADARGAARAGRGGGSEPADHSGEAGGGARALAVGRGAGGAGAGAGALRGDRPGTLGASVFEQGRFVSEALCPPCGG